MLEKLQMMISECLPIVSIKLTGNGEFTIYSEFGIPLAIIEHLGEDDYKAYMLQYDAYYDEFEQGDIVGFGTIEYVVKEALKRIVSDKVSYFLEWQEAQHTINDIEGWEI